MQNLSLIKIILQNRRNFNSEKKLFSKIKEIFQDYKFNTNNPNSNPELIFIVGLPRSGTTLIHQIISSHSKVFGAGELSILRSALLNKVDDTSFLENILKNNTQNNITKKK